MKLATVRRGSLAVLGVIAAGLLWAGCVTGTGIAGKITSGGVGHGGITVEVLAAGDTSTVLRTAVTDTNGNYALTDLDPGSYWVRLAGTSWFDGSAQATPSSTPKAVVVNAGAITTVNAGTTFASGSLSGTITGPAGAPLGGATVAAVSTVDHATVIATTTSAADGSYAFTGTTLPVGSYVVRVAKAGYATAWAPTALSPFDATVFAVTDGGTTTGADGQLTSAAPATLTVTVSNGHTKIAGTKVAVYTTGDHLVAQTTTNASGTVNLGALNPASYHLLLTPPAPYHQQAWGTDEDPNVADSAVVDLSGGDLALSVHVKACDQAAIDEYNRLFNAAGQSLQGCDLTRAMIAGNFSNADIDGADLTNTRVFRFLSSGNTTGEPVGLPTGWALRYGYLWGPQAVLQSINPDHLDTTGLDLTNLDLSEADIRDSDLHGANLSGSTINYAANIDLHDANLTGATINYFTGANLHGANLTNATLGGGDLSGVDLGGTTITGLSVGDISDAPAVLPDNSEMRNGNLYGPGMNFSLLTLWGYDLSGLDLAGANFTNASLWGANLSNTDLSGANFTNTDLRSANLTNANLTGVDLSTANLTGAAWGNTTCPDGTNSSANSPEHC